MTSGNGEIARTSLALGLLVVWQRIPVIDQVSSVVDSKTFVYRRKDGLQELRRSHANAVERIYLLALSVLLQTSEGGKGLQSRRSRYARIPFQKFATTVLLCLWDMKDLILYTRRELHARRRVWTGLTRYGSGTSRLTRYASAVVSGRSIAVVFQALSIADSCGRSLWRSSF